MRRIDDDVIEHTGWSTERHVVSTLDGGVRVADHSAVLLAHENDDVRLVELRHEKRSVSRFRLRRNGDEPLWVEVVMGLHQECTESAEGTAVGGPCQTNDRVAHAIRSGHATG